MGDPGGGDRRFYFPPSGHSFPEPDVAKKLPIGGDPCANIVDLFLCCGEYLTIYLLPVLGYDKAISELFFYFIWYSPAL